MQLTVRQLYLLSFHAGFSTVSHTKGINEGSPRAPFLMDLENSARSCYGCLAAPSASLPPVRIMDSIKDRCSCWVGKAKPTVEVLLISILFNSHQGATLVATKGQLYCTVPLKPEGQHSS